MRKEIYKAAAGVLFGAIVISTASAHAAVVDTYYEDFDNRADDATIDGVDSWSVDEGENTQAVTQDSMTVDGSGKALELTGDVTTVEVSRPVSYPTAPSPCWLEFIISPRVGAEERDVPPGKIAAVTFDYTGMIYASNGSSWENTGVTFTVGEWYRVLLKLDFDTHLYDIYIEPVAVPESEFTPDKEDLEFIDTTISSLGTVGFNGVYNTDAEDDVFIDDLVVYFVDRLELTSSPQTISTDEASAQMTVQLQNADGEPQTAWKDITLELKTSSDGGNFSQNKDAWQSITTVIIPEGSQGAAFYYKDSREGTPVITINEYPDRGWTDASQQEKVVAETAAFDISADTPQVAGEYFTLSITAKDDDGEVDEFYTGEVLLALNYISPDSGMLSILPASVTNFANGIAQVSAMYPDSGVVEITARDSVDSLKSGTSPEITFLPASFTVTASSPQVVAKEFALTVSALNALGDVTPNYQGPATLSPAAVSPSSTDGTISPSSLTGAGFSNGVAQENASFNRWGQIKIKAFDTAYPDQSGESSVIIFNPGEVKLEIEELAGSREFYYVGEDIDMTVSLLNENEEAIANYQGVVSLSFTTGLDLVPEYQFLEAEAGKHVFTTTANSAGSYKVSVKEAAGGLESETISFKVEEAQLIVVSTESPVGTTEVLIKLVDEDGNVISSENNLELTVQVEDDANSSAAVSTDQAPVVFNNGVARVLVSNTEAEVITLAPSSKYKFKVRKGTVTFGRVAKTGIGTLMWREKKE